MKKFLVVMMVVMVSVVFSGCKKETTTDKAEALKKEADKKANEIIKMADETEKPKSLPVEPTK